MENIVYWQIADGKEINTVETKKKNLITVTTKYENMWLDNEW